MDIKLLSKAVLTVAAIFTGCFLFGRFLDFAVHTFSKQSVSIALYAIMAVGLTAIYYQLFKASSK
jgi:hypothetical protein